MSLNEHSPNPVLAQEAEKRFHLFATSVKDYAFILFDRDNRVTGWSRGAEMVLGYTEQEIIGQSGDVLFTPEDRERGEPQQERAQARAEGRAEDERWHLRRDGSRFWASGVMTALRDEGGQLTGFAKVLRDLTTQKLQEDRLHASEQRFRLLVESVTDYALIEVDRQGFVIGWNPGAARTFGYQEPDILGKSINIFFTPADIATDLPMTDLAQAAAEGRAVYERWMIRQDGSRFWANWVTHPVREESGSLRSFVKVLHDITEVRRTQATLEANEKRFRTLAEALPQIMWTARAEGEWDYLNQRWQIYTGRPQEEGLQERWSAALHPEDRVRVLSTWAERIADGQPAEVEFRLRRADGNYRGHLMRAVPVYGEAGQRLQWFGTLIDVDDQKKSEERERQRLTAQAQSAAEALDRTKEELRALAANLLTVQEEERRRISRELHDDLSQQLAFFGIRIGLLRQTLPEDAARLRTELNKLEEQVSTLTNNVRALSHQLHPSILDHLGLTAALARLLEDFQAHRAAPITFEQHGVPDRLSPEISAVLYRITQEALRNIVKHGAADPVTVTLYSEPDEIRLTIQDSGPGFDPETVRGQGGLGLVSMQERAAMVAGLVRFLSQPGQGTTVEVRLPLPSEKA